jgi:hypothetical protein
LEGHSSTALEAGHVVMVPMKTIAQFDFVFPANLQALADAQFFK